MCIFCTEYRKRNTYSTVPNTVVSNFHVNDWLRTTVCTCTAQFKAGSGFSPRDRLGVCLEKWADRLPCSKKRQERSPLARSSSQSLRPQPSVPPLSGPRNNCRCTLWRNGGCGLNRELGEVTTFGTPYALLYQEPTACHTRDGHRFNTPIQHTDSTTSE